MNHTLNNLFALFYSANNVQTAHSLDNTLTIPQYLELAQTEEYKEFSESQLELFTDGWEGALLHRLHQLSEILNNMDASDRNYPQISKEFRETLKITSPLLEKLAKISKETQLYSDLKLVILPNASHN